MIGEIRQGISTTLNRIQNQVRDQAIKAAIKAVPEPQGERQIDWRKVALVSALVVGYVAYRRGWFRKLKRWIG